MKHTQGADLLWKESHPFPFYFLKLRSGDLFAYNAKAALLSESHQTGIVLSIFSKRADMLHRRKITGYPDSLWWGGSSSSTDALKRNCLLIHLGPSLRPLHSASPPTLTLSYTCPGLALAIPHKLPTLLVSHHAEPGRDHPLVSGQLVRLMRDTFLSYNLFMPQNWFTLFPLFDHHHLSTRLSRVSILVSRYLLKCEDDF